MAWGLADLLPGNAKPDLWDRNRDARYVAGILVNGQYWPPDLVPGIGTDYIEVTARSSVRVFYQNAHLFARGLRGDGGSALYCYNGGCF